MKNEHKLKIQSLKKQQKRKEQAELRAGFQSLQEALRDVSQKLANREPIPELESLVEALSQQKDYSEEFNKLDESIKGIKIPDNKEVKIKDLETLVKAASEGKVPKDFNIKALTDTLAAIGNQLGKQDEDLKGKQQPENFIPFRRVYKQGNKFVFDDSYWGGSSGGGGIDNTTLTDGTQKTQIVDAGGEAVTATNGKLDVNAQISAEGLATSDNQTTELTRLGGLTETAPATDTASSGLNGRLQRIAQRITSLIVLFPTALTGAGSFKTAILEALPTGTNLIGAIIPNRPSQGSGRVYKTATNTNQTTSQTLYTVTGGKTLYVTSLIISVLNASSVGMGRLEVRDNGDAGTLLTSVMIPTSVAGTVTPMSSLNLTLQEPLEFTTNVRITVGSGTLTYAATIVGYEE